MLISTHVLSGALLGRAVRAPLPALAAGVVSHLVLDRLPHWGKASGWPPQDLDDEAFRVAVVDGLAGLALIGAVLRRTSPRTRLAVAAAIVGACAPDLDKPCRRWLGGSPWPQRFDRLHAELQVHSEKPHLLPVDIAVALVSAVAVLGALRRV